MHVRMAFLAALLSIAWQDTNAYGQATQDGLITREEFERRFAEMQARYRADLEARDKVIAELQAPLHISFLLIANSGAHVAELQNLFTAIDIFVPPRTARFAVPSILIVGLSCSLLWRRWLVLAQIPSAAELAGLSPARWDVLLLLLLTVILLVRTNALGVVTVLAFRPAAGSSATCRVCHPTPTAAADN